MLNRLLSHDLPRSRLLAVLLVFIVAALLLSPFVFPGSKSLNVAAKILTFVVLVASYDLLLCYTGIVIFRVEDGLMAERWALVDTASLAGQIQGSSLATSMAARPRRRDRRS